MSIADWTESELILDAALNKSYPLYEQGEYVPALQHGEITDRTIAQHLNASVHTAKRRRKAMMNAGVIEYSRLVHVADSRGHLRSKVNVYRLLTDAE